MTYYTPRQRQRQPRQGRMLLRMPAVVSRTGMCTSRVYEAIADKTFTPGIPLDGRSRGWPDDEVDALVGATIAGFTPDQKRSLVARLIAERIEAAAELEV